MEKDAFPALRHKELLSNGGSETLHSSFCLWTCSTHWSSHCHLTSVFPRLSFCFFCLLGADFSASLQLLSGSNCRHSSTLKLMSYRCVYGLFFTPFILPELVLLFWKGQIRTISYYLHQKSDFILFKTNTCLCIINYESFSITIFAEKSHYPTLKR